MVSAVKWVDEVIPDAPYAITEEFMRKLFDEYNIDYIIHGDDPCVLPDGTDAYALAKKAGRYKQIKRTEGVSSTDIVGLYLQFLFFTLLSVCVKILMGFSQKLVFTLLILDFGPKVILLIVYFNKKTVSYLFCLIVNTQHFTTTT